MKTSFRLWAALFVSLWAVGASQTSSQAQSESNRGQFETLDELRSVIGMLLERIDQLEARVEALEATNASAGSTRPNGGNKTIGNGIMQVESIVLLGPDEDLIRQALSLDEKAAESRRLIHVANDNYQKYITIPDRHRLSKSEERRKEDDYRKAREQYMNEAKQHERDAENYSKHAIAKRKEANSPRHLVTGWDGTRTVVLRTMTDQQTKLNKISAGSFVTWWGARIVEETDQHIWEVRGVSETGVPSDFVERPTTE